MPFISEELWQRLPRPESVQSKTGFWNVFQNDAPWFIHFLILIETLPPSICVAPYPTDAEFKVWKDEELEENVKLVSRIVSNVRSVRASYMLPNKTKTKLVLRCSDQEVILFKPWKYALVNNLIGFWQVVDMITHFTGNISTLAFCQPVSVSTDGGSTRGCAIVTVSDKCDAIVHL
jgi:valyl-tRNA synthetase